MRLGSHLQTRVSAQAHRRAAVAPAAHALLSRPIKAAHCQDLTHRRPNPLGFSAPAASVPRGLTRPNAAAEDTKSISKANKKPEWQWEESEDAVKAYAVLAGLLALGALPITHANQIADLPYFVGLAMCTIYIGAHRGLTTKARQQISIKEGVLAPIFASVSLFGLYLLLKYFPDLSIQTLLNAYFFLLGNFALIGATGPVLRQTTGSLGEKSLCINVPEGLLAEEDGTPLTKLEFAPSDLVALAVSLAISLDYLNNGFKDFTANNLIACLIATDILQLIGLRSFRTAGLLLMGLLVYDVFWVFGSPAVVGDNVMLTVATSEMVSGPTRLLFPRVPGSISEGSNFPFSLLGLGDVAIPGLLACLALRYDASRSVDMKGRALAAADAINAAIADLQPGASGTEIANATASAAENAYDKFADRELKQRTDSVDGTNAKSNSAPQAGTIVPVSEAVLEQRTYFMPVMAAYATGLLIAFGVNSVTGAGQPALLYLCPCTLGAVALTALTRNEWGRVWAYTDVASFGVPEKDKDKKKKEKK